MEKQLIKTENLTKKYNNFTAINNINFNLYSGEIYGLIGKNGAGKTTLFKLIMGIAKKTEGEIYIAGTHKVKDINLARSNIGFMITPCFFPYLNAYQNIEYFRKQKGILDKKETINVLKLVNLYDVKKPFKAFSLGMKQRLGLANALLGSPDIVILDEPINGLDPEGIKDIRNIIKTINEEKGITFIISSHILSELDLIASTFGFIDNGVLIKELSYDELHKKTQKSLVIQVDNIAKATVLLETKLQTLKYEISKHKEIILKDYIDESDKVSKVLVENGLKLYKISTQNTTLEEYFMNLIGGNEHE